MIYICYHKNITKGGLECQQHYYAKAFIVVPKCQKSWEVISKIHTKEKFRNRRIGLNNLVLAGVLEFHHALFLSDFMEKQINTR